MAGYLRHRYAGLMFLLETAFARAQDRTAASPC